MLCPDQPNKGAPTVGDLRRARVALNQSMDKERRMALSHAKDKPIAAALQSVVQKLDKPWYRRRALRVFRAPMAVAAGGFISRLL